MMATDINSSPRIVVGVDGSKNARSALVWAVEAARARSAVVDVIYAWHLPALTYGSPVGYAPIDPASFEGAGESVLKDAMQSIETHGVRMATHCLEGPPADVLGRASEAPDVMATVVGARGHSGLAGLMLGSVSHALTHHMTKPLVIVPAAWPAGAATSEPSIVVGVDGSPGATHALEWAMDHAAETGARIEVLMVWPVPDPVLPAGVPLTALAPADRHNSAEGRLLDLVAEVQRDGVKVICTVLTGRPAEVLIDRAADADLLVVGTRGHGRALELLTGSVSHVCAHQSRVPVAIIADAQ